MLKQITTIPTYFYEQMKNYLTNKESVLIVRYSKLEGKINEAYLDVCDKNNRITQTEDDDSYTKVYYGKDIKVEVERIITENNNAETKI